MDKEQELLKKLWEENKELRNKLKKANRRYRYLTNVVRKLKKGLHKGGNLGNKQHNDTAKQADKRIRDIQYPHRGTGSDIRETRRKFRLQFGNSGSDLQLGEGREDSE